MTKLNLAKAYQKLFRRRYPTAVVRPSELRFGNWPGLDVLFLPDGRGREVTRFLLDELPDLRDAAGLPKAMLYTHYGSAPRESYSEVRPRHRVARKRSRGPARRGAVSGRR